ncbi:MAG: lysine--tRNA ligase [Candidatus Omnitrophota bacterium]|jgi:lysyl-tRNA synthetase class 2|nr:MAG: lysine--tRNA ligase [Candidatus Omnitrophota bacterium]
MELNEIIAQRRAKLEALRAAGFGYGDAMPSQHSDIGKALADFQENTKHTFAGRIMAKRLHGKAGFFDLRDSTGKIQLYLKSDIVGEQAFALAQELDVADIVAVEGELFKTHTQEPTLKVDKLFVLVKALRPLPEKWHGLKDIETRYRQRYLDLLANEEAKKVFLTRSRIIRSIRNLLDNKEYQEVETPMMHPIAGGAAGRPFKTHHNEYNMDLFLRIAPELYLKRLLVGGIEKVYEINRSFRNEGVSTKHNPEFTMLEVYAAYADYESMMQLCQELFITLAKELFAEACFTYQGKRIDLSLPWQRVSFATLLKEKFNIDPEDDAGLMLKKLQQKGFAKDKQKLTRSQVTKIIEDVLEQDMSLNPTFVTDYYTALCPLAKTKKDNPLLSERFELYIAGMEVANAYSELNDPQEQRRRFQEEISDGDADMRTVDEDYVIALEHGMPPAGGLGVGIDRLVMLFTDQPSIRDAILFPLLRPSE